MGACDGCLGFFLIGFIASPAILQGIGTFGTDWVSGKSCSTLNYKPSCCNSSSSSTSSRSFSPCHGPYGLNDLHSSVYIMQWIAFAILFTPIGCGLLDIYCSSDKDEEDYEMGGCAILGGFCFIFYPIAGILNFIGCMIIVGVYAGQSFGSSFRVCLAAGLYVLIVTGILIFLLYLKGKQKTPNQTGTVIQRADQPVAAAPYGEMMHAVQVESTEVTTEVHDPETGGFIRLVSKVNVFHQLTHWSS